MRNENRHPIKLLDDELLKVIRCQLEVEAPNGENFVNSKLFNAVKEDSLKILEEYERLCEAYKDIVRRYDDRILIERAKDIICDKMEIGMEEAYRKLQKMASGKNTSVGEIAKRLIDVKELL